MTRPRYRLMAGTRGTGLSPSGSSVIPSGGNIALVQYSAATTADGSAGLTAQMPGSMIVTGIGAGTYLFSAMVDTGDGLLPIYTLQGQTYDPIDFSYGLGELQGAGVWQIAGAGGTSEILNSSSDLPAFPSQASWTGSTVTASNITAGNQVLVGISYATSAMDSAAFVGGGAGALTLVPDSQVTNAGIRTAWYRGTAAGGETGVQFVTDSAVRISIQAMEFSGVSSGAAEGFSTNSGTGEDIEFTEVTPISANNVVLGIGAYANATEDYAGGPSAPFTRQGTGTGGASIFQEVVSAIQSTATPQSGNMAMTVGSPREFATSAIALGAA